MRRANPAIKAFRDTWELEIHSYLTYLRDRLLLAKDLLHERGSIFVQIGDKNVHRVRCLMDEVFGSQNFCMEIVLMKASSQSSKLLPGVNDFLLWFAKDISQIKYKELFTECDPIENPKVEIDEDLIESYQGTVSLPFEMGNYQHVAVKIVDDRGIESLKIIRLT